MFKHIKLYFLAISRDKITNAFFLCLHMFFQIHGRDVERLPEALADRAHLLPELLRKSRADSTTKKYESAFTRFHKWALSNGLGSGDVLPARALTVAIYLASLIQNSNSSSSVISAYYAIKWYHEINGLNSPTCSTLVSNVLESGKRILAKKTVKKEPITVDIILAVYNRIYQNGNLKSQRVICAILLGYSGFMRSKELLNIKISDIIFQSTYMCIFIESSKTDKYRDGAWIVIAKTGTELCPVENVIKYITWSKLCNDDFLFCNLCATKVGYTVRKTNKQMSYTNMREVFLEALAPHVENIKMYALHSLRSGGATAAANNGVKDRMFKRHGRWISESAKDGYIKDNVNERLAVSLNLGL
jgi:integrase